MTPRKQVKEHQAELQKIVNRLIGRANIPYNLKVKVKKYRFFVCDVVRGWTSSKNLSSTIPLWSKEKSQDYFIYYISHELSHVIGFCDNINDHHGKNFYKIFSDVCPVKYQHFELGYKPRNAKKFGIK